MKRRIYIVLRFRFVYLSRTYIMATKTERKKNYNMYISKVEVLRKPYCANDGKFEEHS